VMKVLGAARNAVRRIPRLAKGAFAAAVAIVGLLGGLQQLGVLPFGGGSKDHLENAITKIRDAGSSRIDFARTARSPSGVTSEQAQGEFDYRAGTGELNFTSGLREIFLKPYLYEFGASRQPVWCKYDLSVLGPGFLFGAVTGFQNDPGAALVNLKQNGSYKKVGEEPLFNIPTTHYSGHVDLKSLLDQARDPAIRPLLRQFSSFNSGKLPVDVWLNSDDAVQRLSASFDVVGTQGRVHFNATFDFSRYGVAVRVRQPPRSKIAEAGKEGCPEMP
jgi:hypothetical protein